MIQIAKSWIWKEWFEIRGALSSLGQGLRIGWMCLGAAQFTASRIENMFCAIPKFFSKFQYMKFDVDRHCMHGNIQQNLKNFFRFQSREYFSADGTHARPKGGGSTRSGCRENRPAAYCQSVPDKAPPSPRIGFIFSSNLCGNTRVFFLLVLPWSSAHMLTNTTTHD